ncbi:single-stranded-DNA-specific exonuclease [Thermosyntropha lipolytica DSM 11003]|uniref:Single-stranded-DNA-specific exonuclease RecJ n=1 Tax=Thermosyntropha lipolytica DSM 11003 TaxID=1123382 RepID=A0A1M5P0X6_9FIRM|nr:single-stranded-DNA-specific exonuclease RecJ [Thermosyntropha lipolytica]SHG95357.1 single-stranded-DNA-specific exonuclease [Thermosyntropha lipolytica DSM 11003]
MFFIIGDVCFLKEANNHKMTVWKIKDFSRHKAGQLQDKLGLSWPLAVLLTQRGIDEEAKVHKFLAGGLNDLISPYRMQGINQAVLRIKEAVSRGEKVVIYGDYDVDGICSTVIMLKCLEKLGLKADYYIPDRFSEGYGLNEEAVIKLAEKGYNLLISVDCGITSVKEAETAAQLGMDMIITDHHTPPEVLPEAKAIINPKLDEEEDIMHLAGAGVVFKLAEALIGEEAYHFIELAALATVADIMPLTGDNRIIVKEGLKRMPATRNRGLKALLEKTGLREKEEITPWHLGFIIAPRINSAGRLYKADLAVELFLRDDEAACQEIAEKLCQLNNERKNLEDCICKEVVLKVENEVDLEREKIIVVAGDNWHPGVLGIVASRICERYNRPAVLISWEEGMGRGSGRSTGDINLYEALASCRSELVHFGGHKMAAGLTIERDKFAVFKEKLSAWARDNIDAALLKPVLLIDCEIRPEDINERLLDEIEKLKPYGEGNEIPYFIARKMEVTSAYLVGKDRDHVKMNLNPGNLAAVAFGKPEFMNFPLDKCYHDVVFYLEYNDFRGERTIQLKIKEIKPSFVPDNPYIASSHLNKREWWTGILSPIEEGKPVVLLYPTYRVLKKHALQLELFFRPGVLCAIHGKLAPEERKRRLQYLIKNENKIFLLTQALYDYICKKKLVKDWPYIIKVMDDKAGAGIYYGYDNWEEQMVANIKWKDKWRYSGKKKVLVYANKMSTLKLWQEKIPNVLIEAGEEDVRKRDYMRHVFDALEEGVLLTDGGTGRFIAELDEVVFADMPLSLYETRLVMDQIAAADQINPVFLFSQEKLDEHDIFLKRHYPDAGIVKSVLTYLFRHPGAVLEVELEKLTHEVNKLTDGDLKKQDVAAVLHILSDLDLCQIRKKGSIMEIKLLQPAVATVDIAESPYYLEGLAEKKAFYNWKSRIMELWRGDNDVRNRNDRTGKNN